MAYNARFVLGLFIHDDERLSLLASKEGRMIHSLFFESLSRPNKVERALLLEPTVLITTYYELSIQEATGEGRDICIGVIWVQ